MYRHFTRKALGYGAVFHALCVIALAFPQSGVVANHPEAAAVLRTADVLAGRQQFVEAAKLYEQALGMLEKSLGASHPAAVAAAQSRRAFRQSLMPELLDRLMTIISLSEFRDREFDQTVAEIREMLPVSPLRERSYELIKDGLLGVGLKAETEMVVRTGLGAFPESRLLRIYLAEVLSESGRSVDALSILEEAGRLPRPEGIDASTDREQRALVFQHIGRIHSGLAHLDDAVTAYRRAVEIAPGASDGRVKLGRAYFTGNRLDEAQSEFERAARAAPDNKEAHLGLSGVYLARSQWRLAATAAERAVKLDPSNSRGLYLLGTALLRMGRHEEGQARLREFAKVESNAREVERRYVEIDAISLGAIRALREGNGNGAIQQLMQGIASHPASSRLHMNLAMILSRVGQHQGAVEILESMLKRTNDGRLLIHKHLAGEYKVLGDLEASRHHRQIYLDTRGVEFIASASPLN